MRRPRKPQTDKMRVISGYLGGRIFNSPKGHRTHPMSDKVRGGLFAVLGDLDGLSILDVYSGSGALAIEAISRGAGHAIAIEADKSAHSAIERNVRILGISDKVKATRAFISSWSLRNEDKLFDLVLADPPYDDIDEKEIGNLTKHLKANGILVLSWPGNRELPAIGNVELLKNKDYGDARLAFYKKIS
jgi:16S rRNA (guanine966-N2)-methyltransferase